MPYAFHIVPRKQTSEVLLSLVLPGGLGQPLNQRTFPNWVRMMQEIGPYLPEQDRQRTKQSLLAGRTHVLPQVWLTENELDHLGL